MGVYCGSATTYLAIKAAVRSARREILGTENTFKLRMPTTPANVIDAIYDESKENTDNPISIKIDDFGEDFDSPRRQDCKIS